MLVMAQEFPDISNFTTLPDSTQQAYLKYNVAGIMIGLQDAGKAKDFKAMAIELGLERAYYADILGRDLTIPEDGSYCSIDIESGCFTSAGDVEQQIKDQIAELVQIMVYGNYNSITPVMGTDTRLSQFPLHWANYGDRVQRDPRSFRPFLGWDKLMMQQYDSGGILGVNCDRNLLLYYDDGPLIWSPPASPIPAPVQQESLVATVQVFNTGRVELV